MRSFRLASIRRVAKAAPLLLVAVSLLGPAAPADAFGSFPVPKGYTVTSKQSISPTLMYVQMKSSNPRRVINLAFLKKGGPEHFRMMLSNERVAGPKPWTETISSMCHRIKCRIAVNGDFFSNTTGQPAGGIAIDGAPIRMPPSDRYHFVADWNGNYRVMKQSLTLRLYATYPNGQKPFYIHGLNTARAANRMIIYTPKWGPTTETTTNGFELVIKVTNPPLLMGKSATVSIVSGTSGKNSKIPADGLVLSGSDGNGTALSQLWTEVKAGRVPAQAQMTFVAVPNVRMFVGGTPALLMGGNRAFTNDGSSFMNTRNPHTMIGRLGSGDAIIAVVDGRQSSWSVGMTVMEEADFMKGMGAVEALNLDGGGSSEMVKNGYVISKPSDGGERSIAAAITIV